MLGYSLIVLGLIALGLALALLHWLLNADGMLWVQVRRRLVVLRFFLFTLRRNKPVPLDAVYAAVTATYAASGFTRQLGPDEVAQLALQAGFSQPAAAALRARAVADAAVQAQARNAGEDAKLTTLLAAQRSGAARRLPTVTIPRWRLKYFMWWLHSHLHTLNILRTEWEHESPLLICGFDVTRDAADALLFRRPKGTCLVRLGQQVGGVIVSLRPDKPSLAAEPRTQESYYSSVSVSQLVGAAYQAAEQAWLPVRRKLREGSVVHVYLPDASLRQQGGLWGCLRRMRHTKFLLDVPAGEVTHTSKAFQFAWEDDESGRTTAAKRPPSSPSSADGQRHKLLRQHSGSRQAAAGSGAVPAAPGSALYMRQRDLQ
jgi:hypothetical protein